MTRPFRFAVITSKALDARAWRDRARRAEALGYSTLLDRWGFTYIVVPDDAMEAFAPVVEQLAGRS